MERKNDNRKYMIDRKKKMELNKGVIVEWGNFQGKVNVHGGGGGGGE